METSRSNVRYLLMPSDAGDDEAAAVMAAVVAFLEADADDAPAPMPNTWGAAGRREAQSRPVEHGSLQSGWGGR
jgi:hypothetical protein